MDVLRLRLRRGVWLAWLAVFGLAGAPGVSRLLAGDAFGLGALCSEQADKPPAQGGAVAYGAAALDHCLLCALGADAPPLAASGVVMAVSSAAPPTLWARAAQAVVTVVLRWASARGPPQA